MSVQQRATVFFHSLICCHLTDAKKSGVKESVFKALEPVTQNDRSKTGPGHRFLGFGKSSPDWFRAHKEFFMPTLVSRAGRGNWRFSLLQQYNVELTVVLR